MTDLDRTTHDFALVYRVIFVVMILTLLATGVIVILDGEATLQRGRISPVVPVLVHIYLFLVPCALAAFTTVTAVRKNWKIAVPALLLTLLWVVFKLL